MKFKILPTLFFIVIGLNSSVSLASTKVMPIQSAAIQLAQNGQTLSQAEKSIKKEHGGQILSAKTVIINGQRIHKIKVLLPSGKVRVFKVAAE